MDPITISGLFGIGGKLIDKLFPDPTEKARAQLELLRLQQSGELDEMKTALSAIIAEANSSDPWTSRARPSFLYLFYLIVAFLVIIAPIIGVFFPDQMGKFFINVAAGFGAIPEPMWWTFTTGYLGYTAARQVGKIKGTDK
jgi:hypothetical protein